MRGRSPIRVIAERYGETEAVSTTMKMEEAEERMEDLQHPQPRAR